MGCKADKPKQKHKKGLWSPDEDQKLRDYILRHGHGCWSSVPINAGQFFFPPTFNYCFRFQMPEITVCCRKNVNAVIILDGNLHSFFKMIIYVNILTEET